MGMAHTQPTAPPKKEEALLRLTGLLKGFDFAPRLILDIGANHGNWSRTMAAAFPQARLVMVEPQKWLAAACNDLIEKGHTFIAAGAGRKPGSQLFTFNTDRDDSSSFTTNTQEAVARGYRQDWVEVVTIDSLVQQWEGQVPDIIKIDAEGLDLEVIEGASGVLGKTEVILIEAAVNASFEDTNMCCVMAAMDLAGYRLFDITELNRPFEPRILWLVELVFIKKNGLIHQKIAASQ